MDDNSKNTKRRNKYAGKEDISRETAENLLSSQIDQLREISRINNETATKINESVNVLYETCIPVDTAKFEQLNRYFIEEVEDKLRKVKQPSKGLKWYITMWVITLISALLSGFFIQESWEWKEKAMYWHQQYEEVKAEKIDKS